jgi:hypothetical protein
LRNANNFANNSAEKSRSQKSETQKAYRWMQPIKNPEKLKQAKNFNSNQNVTQGATGVSASAS